MTLSIRYSLLNFAKPLQTWRLWYLILPFFSLLSGCDFLSSSTNDHPEYFDKVFEKAIKIREHGNPDGSIAFVDSVFRVYPQPGIGDLFRKYDHIRYCYFYDKKDYDQAMRYSDSSLFVIQNYANKKKYMWSYASGHFFKGDNYLEQKKYNDAFQAFYKGKLIAESIYDPCALSEFDSRLALVCYRQGNFADAAVYFKMAFKKINTCDVNLIYVYEQQRLLDNLALSFDKSGMLDSAIYYYDYALKFINAHEKNYPEKADLFDKAKGVIYGNQGETYFKKGLIDTSETLLLKSININQRDGFDNNDARFSMIKLANLYLDQGNIQKAEILKDRVYNLLKLKPDLETDFRWRYLNWKFYDKTHQTDKAYRALQSYNSIKDTLTEDNKKLLGTSIREEFENLERQHQLEFFKKSDELKRAYLIIIVLVALFALLLLFITWKNWKRTQANLNRLDVLYKHISYQKIQLEDTLEVLEQNNKYKDRIIKVVAHDLINPLGAINNITQVLLTDKDLNEEQEEMVKLIKAASGNSIEMINDLLEIRFDNEQPEVKKEPKDIKALLKECVSLLQFKAKEKNQTLELSGDNDQIIPVNHEQITRVVLNLIVNAIKFSPNNEIIRIGLRKQHDGVKITVEDNGVGIDAENSEKIFEMFTSAKRTGTAGEPSYGLGLSISKRIVEAHGGTIGFITKKNKGSIFYINLPKNSKPKEKS